MAVRRHPDGGTLSRGRVHLAVAGCVLVACRPPGEGSLRARWTSTDTTLARGAVSLPLRATWCESRGRLTLLAVSGDTGVGILVRTVALAPGLFQVSDTTAARSPGAGMALRLTRPNTLYTLSADSGAVAITSVAEGRVDGRYIGWLSQPGTGPVLLTGSFAGAAAVPDPVRCDREASVPEAPAAPDSSVP